MHVSTKQSPSGCFAMKNLQAQFVMDDLKQLPSSHMPTCVQNSLLTCQIVGLIIRLLGTKTWWGEAPLSFGVEFGRFKSKGSTWIDKMTRKIVHFGHDRSWFWLDGTVFLFDAMHACISVEQGMTPFGLYISNECSFLYKHLQLCVRYSWVILQRHMHNYVEKPGCTEIRSTLIDFVWQRLQTNSHQHKWTESGGLISGGGTSPSRFKS